MFHDGAGTCCTAVLTWYRLSNLGSRTKTCTVYPFQSGCRKHEHQRWWFIKLRLWFNWPLECEIQWQPGSRYRAAWFSLSFPLYVHTYGHTKNIIISISIFEMLQFMISAFGSSLASSSFLYLFINHSFLTPFLCPCNSRVSTDREGRKKQRKWK